MRLLTIILIFLIGLSACQSDKNSSSAAQFNLECDTSLAYQEQAAPIESNTTSTSKATVIILHGKNGSPTKSFLVTLTNSLNTLGYDVIAPYMPWSGLSWDGTLCQGIAYTHQLIESEKNKGNKVILLGHSLGATIALAYAALDNTSKPDAFNILAPGHFIHQSAVLDAAHGTSIQTAKNMIASGDSSSNATFVTYNNGNEVNISATPDIYLSYHDTNQFPDIAGSLPRVSDPMLWLTGSEDSLTNSANKFSLPELLPGSNGNRYKVISGDHYTIMSGVGAELDSWFSGL